MMGRLLCDGEIVVYWGDSCVLVRLLCHGEIAVYWGDICVLGR